MAFRSIIIESDAHISARNCQLIVRTDAEHSVALEDISAVLIESRRSTITTAALSLLGQCGCAVFTCDDKHMIQYSVYARVCNGIDAVEKHRARVKQNLPDNGAIRLLVITEKQFESIDILLGRLTEADEPFQCEQLTIF